jgi:Domain of unknown function (DUF4398)
MKSFDASMVLIFAAFAGCAGTTAPVARMASAQAAIRSAAEVGAERTPTAALYLQYAREAYAEADRLSLSGDGVRAERRLLRAQADAELALAISRGAASRAATDGALAQPTTPMSP